MKQIFVYFIKTVSIFLVYFMNFFKTCEMPDIKLALYRCVNVATDYNLTDQQMLNIILMDMVCLLDK